MPTTKMRSVPARNFPEMGPEVKQVENLIDLPNIEDKHRHYDQEERLFVGSRVKSDVKDCHTRTDRNNQDNIIYKPFASAPNLLGIGRPPSQYESNAAIYVFKNIQPVSQLAYTSAQSGSTLVETPKVLVSKTSGGESSYEAPKSSDVGSSKIFAVQAPEHAYDHVVFKPQVSGNALVAGPNQAQSNFISSQFSKQHGASQIRQSFRKFQAAGSTYGPVLMGAPVHSRTNLRKPSHGGLTHSEAKPSVVSSGPIFILQGSKRTQGPKRTPPNSVKPQRVPINVDFSQYVNPQSSQTSSVALNVGGRHSKSWNEPLYNSMRGGQSSAGSMPPKQSGGDCRDDVGKNSVASSGEIRLRALENAEGGKSVPHYESREDVRHPRKFQKTYNTCDPYPVYSVSGSNPNQVKPMYPTQSGAQHNVVQSSIASSGEIRVMSVPVNVQSKTHSNKLQVSSKPNASSPEHRVIIPSTQTALPYQPFEANQNSRNVQPTTGIYARPPQSGYKVFSSFTGTSYKPGSASPNALSESRYSATKPSVAVSDEINAVRVRLNKWPKSSFGNLQNQWASGNDVGALTANSGAQQRVLPSSDLGQRQGQNVQIPVRSSVPMYRQSAEIQENSHVFRHDKNAIPDVFGKGVIRRLSTISSHYRPGLI